MADVTVPDRSGLNPKRMLLWILWVQLALGGLLVLGDIGRVLPQILSPSNAPGLLQPTAPGDQTRQYDPAVFPRREADPGTRPLPIPDEMPSRLLFERATFEGQTALILTGDIAPGDAQRLRERLEADPDDPQVVFLNSPGGSVTDALAIGRMLRELAVETRMSAVDICLSACPYIFASGTTRVADPDALIGVHQHFFGENTALPAFLAVEDIQRGQGEVMAYLIEMGVDPAVMQHALVTPPDEIYLLTPTQREDYALVTPAD